jgi:hypothetical protein
MTKYILFILALFLANICSGQLEDDSNFLKINFKAESTIKVDFRNFNDTVLLSSHFIIFSRTITLKALKNCYLVKELNILH